MNTVTRGVPLPAIMDMAPRPAQGALYAAPERRYTVAPLAAGSPSNATIPISPVFCLWAVAPLESGAAAAPRWRHGEIPAAVFRHPQRPPLQTVDITGFQHREGYRGAAGEAELRPHLS